MFDHAAQFFTATDPWFAQQVEQWEREGIVHRWEGPVGTLRGGTFEADPDTVRYVAKGGMRFLAEHLASELHAEGVEMRRPCWVSNLFSGDKGWTLKGRNEDQGLYDFVVIAHNGKCAKRLLQPAGTPILAAQMSALQLSAIWVLMVTLCAPPLPGSIVGYINSTNPTNEVFNLDVRPLNCNLGAHGHVVRSPTPGLDGYINGHINPTTTCVFCLASSRPVRLLNCDRHAVQAAGMACPTPPLPHPLGAMLLCTQLQQG